MPMQHLDGDAEAIIKLANDIAREYELEYVGTEHILLAILRHGGGMGNDVLAHFKIDEKRAKNTIDDIAQRDKEDTWVFGRLPGTPHFRNVMALAIDEAHRLKCDRIGSAQLLLALLREKQSAGERALKKMGMTLKAAREEVEKRLAK